MGLLYSAKGFVYELHTVSIMISRAMLKLDIGFHIEILFLLQSYVRGIGPGVEPLSFCWWYLKYGPSLGIWYISGI